MFKDTVPETVGSGKFGVKVLPVVCPPQLLTLTFPREESSLIWYMDKPATDTVVVRAITAIGQKSLGVPSLTIGVPIFTVMFPD